MTLTIETQEDDQRQLMMSVEVAEERVDQAMRQAARKLARDIHIPGFRRGRAPYQVILRRVGRDALRADTIEDMIQPVLEEAIGEVGADIAGTPSLDDMEMEPLVFKFTVPLSPVVELGAYREIRKDVEPVVVNDEAVDEALEQVQIRHQVVEEVERPSEAGDIVTVSGKGELNSESDVDEDEGSGEASDPSAENDLLFDEDSIDFLLDDQKLFVGTPFVENLIGSSAGDERSFSFTFPDDYESEELAGKEVTFELAILNVKSRDLPALDDDLAQQEGDYETLTELRESLRERLENEARSEAKNELIDEMVSDLLSDAKLVYPPSAVESELDDIVHSFRDQITRSGWEWEDYLKLQGRSEDEVREEQREAAKENLERRLVLRQFVLDEKLTVEEEDVDAAIADRVSAFGANEDLKESMTNYFRSGYGFDMISSEILMDKVHERVELILSGNAPELTDEEETSGDEEE